MKTVAIIFLLVGVLGVVSEVQAQTIYGCVNAKGTLRIVSGEGQCKLGKENEISWNQQGPKGDKGDPGKSPVLSWVGDQISIDGTLGPHLTGGDGSQITDSGIYDSSGQLIGHSTPPPPPPNPFTEPVYLWDLFKIMVGKRYLHNGSSSTGLRTVRV